jgi:hypothetical protein
VKTHAARSALDIEEAKGRRIRCDDQAAGVEHDQRVGHGVKDVCMEAIEFQIVARTPG